MREADRQRIGERIQTADGRRQTAGGRWTMREADRQRIGERINEWRLRTADGRRAGFSARREGRSLQDRLFSLSVKDKS